ncbi:MAG: NAD(P)/FAD-dependent oxidoreductase [Patescibacteria group bacterium]|nr:NAD(P)/FAD-dependent oxidoreductase [Patescibacteria group bacterium]
MKIAIVGGGAAGLMAAAAIIETNPEAEIFLIDKNEGLGKKVIISGGGRCNVTTGIQDVKTVLTKYPRGGKFLNSAMHKFPPKEAYEWFESHGVPLKIEKDLRVFPISNDGHDIVRIFEELFRRSRVVLLMRTQVVGLEKHGDGFKLKLKGSDDLAIDKVILTTGGQAYRQTGSTGDGYALAASLGHTITELAPSLSALLTQETWTAEISGLSFPNVKTSAGQFQASGPMLFTHKGVSGPAVFAFSSLVAFEKFDNQNPLEITIDLFPDKTAAELTRFIESFKRSNPKKSWLNILSQVVPKSLAEIVCRHLGLSAKNAGDVNKQDLAASVDWFKKMTIHVVSRSAGDEFVTAGGVNLKEVDPSTMQSKICSGLYFAGEILDIDGFTGGFNLQASWAAGRLAGASAAA